jgi:hypothetical protein
MLRWTSQLVFRLPRRLGVQATLFRITDGFEVLRHDRELQPSHSGMRMACSAVYCRETHDQQNRDCSVQGGRIKVSLTSTNTFITLDAKLV